MKRAEIPLVASFLVLVLAIAAPGQDSAAPDLSGTWTFNAAKSKVSKKIGLASGMLVIKCAGASIEFASSSNGEQFLELYVVDGKEHVDLNAGGAGQWYSKARWNKTTLVTEAGERVKGLDRGDFEIIHYTTRWSLSPDGRILTREIEYPKQVLVYDKQ
jgi:hypothetical protein